MKVYQNENGGNNKEISNLSQDMRKKAQKKTYNLEHHLATLEKNLSSGFSPLYL